MILLVADTNLFFECKPLDQLPWHELDGDEVVIILTKPVLDEIDKHKKGTGRTRDRALEIFSRVREMLMLSMSECLIQASSPKVVLRRAANERPDKALADDLDYSKNDDRLIGITATIAAANAGYNVRLFTDDTGPAATADGLNVPFLMISSAWRRPAAETTETKRIKALEKDLDTYRSQEPVILINHAENADERNRIAVIRKIVAPLTNDEIDRVVDALRSKHPVRADFSPPAARVEGTALGAIKTTEYFAPADEAVNEYRDGAYSRWIKSCREVLEHFHEGRGEIEPPIVLRWSMSNVGTRPATRVRVEFEAKGSLGLRRIAKKEDQEGSPSEPPPAQTAHATRLPAPPAPPRFQERVTHTPSPDDAQLPPYPGAARSSSALIASSGVTSLPALESVMRSTRTLENVARGFSDVSGLLTQADNLRRMGMLDASLLQVGDPSGAAARAMNSLSRFSDPSNFASSAFSSATIEIPKFIMPHIENVRDAEDFYYDWPLRETVQQGALTCQLWRHQSDIEFFEFEVLFTREGEVQGSVECRVHAENLTKPAEARAIVSRSIETVCLLDLAISMVAACR